MKKKSHRSDPKHGCQKLIVYVYGLFLWIHHKKELEVLQKFKNIGHIVGRMKFSVSLCLKLKLSYGIKICASHSRRLHSLEKVRPGVLQAEFQSFRACLSGTSQAGPNLWLPGLQMRKRITLSSRFHLKNKASGSHPAEVSFINFHLK